MPPQSKNQPPACSDLREALQELKEKQAEFRSALDQGRTTGDLKPAQALKAEIEQKIASLKEKLWPFKELSQPELEKQYQTQKEIFQKTGILERLSNGELGIKGITETGTESVEIKIEELGELEQFENALEGYLSELEKETEEFCAIEESKKNLEISPR